MSSRIEELQSRLAAHGVQGAILIQSRDVYYYSGTGEPCNLWIPAEGNPILFARRCFDVVKQESWIEDIREAPSFRALAEAVATKPHDSIGVEMDIIPAKLYESLRRAFPMSRISDVSPLVMQQRAVKDSEELAIVRESAKLYRVAYDAMVESIRPGATEVDVAQAWYSAVRKQGADDWIFQRRWDATLPADGLTVSGSNLWQITGHAMTVTGQGLGAHLPWGAGLRTLEHGDLVVTDLGIGYKGYASDFARTFSVGQASDEARNIYKALLEVMDAAIEKLQPGVEAKEVFLAAKRKADALGYGEYFQGFSTRQGSYIGHSIGLEIDEFPTLDDRTTTPIEAGMVLTIEPKFIIPEWGAVCVEDSFIVTSHGPENLAPVGRDLRECGC